MNISLQGALRTCKVDQGWAARVESDRFLNPELALCPVWTGVDSLGRQVCPFSYNTKNAGCNSASDIVSVENDQRPRYVEYVTLNARGFLNEQPNPTLHLANKAAVGEAVYNDYYKIGGNFGESNIRASTYPNCNQSGPQAQAQINMANATQAQARAFQMRQGAGMGNY